jgi:hypothetical protein
MSKFICLCGCMFKKQKDADIHTKMYEDLALIESFPRHKIFKQHWQARFLDWFLNYRWQRFFRFVGAYMFYFVFIHHFQIDWSWWEATLIGVGMGLYIE